MKKIFKIYQPKKYIQYILIFVFQLWFFFFTQF